LRVLAWSAVVAVALVGALVAVFLYTPDPALPRLSAV
jgi:hypothetical protein